ncbi:MAG: hypothetical protein AAFO88_02355 [Pseudomonadota bacterium]
MKTEDTDCAATATPGDVLLTLASARQMNSRSMTAALVDAALRFKVSLTIK